MDIVTIPLYEKFTPIPGLHIRVHPLAQTARTLLTSPPAADYAVRRPQIFAHTDFTCSFLSDEELTRLNQFKAMKKQVEWMSGRFALKILAREMLMPGRDLADIRIDYMDKGAPYLAGHPDHCLSLSHSGLYTAAALAKTPDIRMGIDLEKIGKTPDDNFMRTAFTNREIRAMGRLPQDIFRCWTLKEAFLKYIRLGFNENLHNVEILKDRIVYCNRDVQKVSFRSRELAQGYLLSMVWSEMHPAE